MPRGAPSRGADARALDTRPDRQALSRSNGTAGEIAHPERGPPAPWTRNSNSGSCGMLSGRRRATALLATRLDSVVDCSGSCGMLSGRRRATALLATRLDSVVDCSGSCDTLSGRRRATVLLTNRLDSVVGCSGSSGTLPPILSGGRSTLPAGPTFRRNASGYASRTRASGPSLNWGRGSPGRPGDGPRRITTGWESSAGS